MVSQILCLGRQIDSLFRNTLLNENICINVQKSYDNNEDPPKIAKDDFHNLLNRPEGLISYLYQ